MAMPETATRNAATPTGMRNAPMMVIASATTMAMSAGIDAIPPRTPVRSERPVSLVTTSTARVKYSRRKNSTKVPTRSSTASHRNAATSDPIVVRGRPPKLTVDRLWVAPTSLITPSMEPPSLRTWPPSATAPPRTLPLSCTMTSPRTAVAAPSTFPYTSRLPRIAITEPDVVVPAGMVRSPV